MQGKLVAGLIVLTAVVAGAGLYYLQVFHFYERVAPETVVLHAAGVEAPLSVSGLEAIDATSSPIRFRACFQLDEPLTPDALVPYPTAEPLVAPFWFDCFDATAIGAALETGAAQAVLSQAEIAHGVDRVLALFPDGRGYAWHQLNPEFSE